MAQPNCAIPQNGKSAKVHVETGSSFFFVMVRSGQVFPLFTFKSKLSADLIYLKMDQILWLHLPAFPTKWQSRILNSCIRCPHKNGYQQNDEICPKTKEEDKRYREKSIENTKKIVLKKLYCKYVNANFREPLINSMNFKWCWWVKTSDKNVSAILTSNKILTNYDEEGINTDISFNKRKKGMFSSSK